MKCNVMCPVGTKYGQPRRGKIQQHRAKPIRVESEKLQDESPIGTKYNLSKIPCELCVNPLCFWWYNTIRTVTKIFLFYEIFSLYLHTNKIQIMYNVSLHNILQLATRKSQVKLVQLNFRKVRSFFHFFQTIHKIFSLHPLCLFLVILLSLNSSALICLISVICVLLHFNGTLITHMVMMRYDFIISDHHLNQRHPRSIVKN